MKENRARRNLEIFIDENGCEQRAEAFKGDVTSKYFNKLFNFTSLDNFQELFHDPMPKVTDEMNQVLIEPVTKEEIRDAIFSIKASKAPGVNGMTGMFY